MACSKNKKTTTQEKNKNMRLLRTFVVECDTRGVIVETNTGPLFWRGGPLYTYNRRINRRDPCPLCHKTSSRVPRHCRNPFLGETENDDKSKQHKRMRVLSFLVPPQRRATRRRRRQDERRRRRSSPRKDRRESAAPRRSVSAPPMPTARRRSPSRPS